MRPETTSRLGRHEAAAVDLLPCRPTVGAGGRRGEASTSGVRGPVSDLDAIVAALQAAIDYAGLWLLLESLHDPADRIRQEHIIRVEPTQ